MIETPPQVLARHVREVAEERDAAGADNGPGLRALADYLDRLPLNDLTALVLSRSVPFQGRTSRPFPSSDVLALVETLQLDPSSPDALATAFERIAEIENGITIDLERPG